MPHMTNILAVFDAVKLAIKPLRDISSLDFQKILFHKKIIVREVDKLKKCF